MISNDPNMSQSWAGWLKWLIGTAVALVAAGGSIVAILEYLEPESTYAPTDNSITVVIVTTKDTQFDPQPTQMSPQSNIIYETPVLQKPDPAEFVVSYWQNVNSGKFESAWAQLSPGFQRAMHNDDYTDYLQGYQDMNLCRIVVSNLNLVHQDSFSAIVDAHFAYYAGPLCNSSEYDFEMWLVFDGVSNSWLFDKNIVK